MFRAQAQLSAQHSASQELPLAAGEAKEFFPSDGATVPVSDESTPRVRRVRRRGRRGLATAHGAFHAFGQPPHRFTLWGALVVVGLAASPLLARAPTIRFDTSALVSCRDMTTDSFVAVNPHERLVEARFRVTAIVEDGQVAATTQYVYRFLSPSGRLRVVDYRPKTRQATAVAGNVSVEKKRESSKSLGLSLSGSFEHLVQGTAGSDIGSKNGSNIRYELKPPMEVVFVAGTIERGTGVYFKMRPSPDRSLEGAREFVLVLRVPRSWRGDVMYVRCEAQQNHKGKLSSQGVSRFIVGLCATGDDEARVAAEELGLAEARLRRTVMQQRKAIQKKSIPSLVHQVGALLDVYNPRIPATWLDRLLYGSVDAEGHEFYRYLPDSVRREADNYRYAKRKMYQLSGSRLAMQGDVYVRG